MTPLTLEALLAELADTPEVLLIRGGDPVARAAAADEARQVGPR
jgi:sulfur carrier protein ThiS